MVAPKVVWVALLAATLGACSSDATGPKATGTGALASGPATAPPTLAAAPLLGAPSVGLVGGTLGASLDEQDRQRAYAAEMNALEYSGPGTPVGWRGESGAYGTVIAGPAYARTGNPRCRDYSHTIYIQGRPQTARGVACRNGDGTWVPAG